MLPFKDISENQGKYNMDANTDQAIAIRMSTGVLMRFDYEAARNYDNAIKAGKTVINYHYAGHNNPVDEARLFIAAVSPFAEGDVYCLDAELGQTKEWKQAFCDYVFEQTGCRPWDYMNISTTNELGACNDSGLWLAAPSWGFEEDIKGLNKGTVYIAQQGPIVNGVDTNMFFGSLVQLRQYGYHAVATGSVPTPPAEPTPVPQPTPEPAPTPEPSTPVVEPLPTPSPVPETPGSPETPPVVVPGPDATATLKSTILTLLTVLAAAIAAFIAWLHG